MKARPLEEKGIRVIPVALGSESDPKELTIATTNKMNLIKAGDNEDPKTLGDKIMDKVIEGKYPIDSSTLKLLVCMLRHVG